MIRPNARRDITGVADKQTVGNGALYKQPDNTMGELMFPAKPKLPVVRAGAATAPLPATFGLLHPRPKSIFCC